jgi:uncharacterized phage-associated protein
MTDIYELAKAFLFIEPMSNKKLQKMCYYAKAWYLALYDDSIIDESFEAWVHGPVNRALHKKYRDYGGDLIKDDVASNDIPADLLAYVKQVYDAYGHMDGDELEIISNCANETEKRKKAESEKDARKGSFSKGAVSAAD